MKMDTVKTRIEAIVNDELTMENGVISCMESNLGVDIASKVKVEITGVIPTQTVTITVGLNIPGKDPNKVKNYFLTEIKPWVRDEIWYDDVYDCDEIDYNDPNFPCIDPHSFKVSDLTNENESNYSYTIKFTTLPQREIE